MQGMIKEDLSNSFVSLFCPGEIFLNRCRIFSQCRFQLFRKLFSLRICIYNGAIFKKILACHRHGTVLEIIADRFPGKFKKVFNIGRLGKQRRARVKCIPILLKKRKLAARVCISFKNFYGITLNCQPDGDGEAAHTRTYYNCFFQID